MFNIVDEMFVFMGEHPRPGNVIGSSVQIRRSIIGAGLAIQLMSEFMKDHIVPIMDIRSALKHIIPG